MGIIKVKFVIMQEVNFVIVVVGFVQLMKDVKYIGQWLLDDVFNLVLVNKGEDYYGYCGEFI